MSQRHTEPKRRANRMPKRLGLILLILSIVFYGLALVIPFIPVSTTTKFIFVPTFAILGEIVFWISCIIGGKKLVKRYRNQLNPANWFKRTNKKTSTEDHDS